MDKQCRGRISKEVMYDQNERLSSKHIQTLSLLQELSDENKQLKTMIVQLQMEQKECEEYHALAEESKERMKELQEKYLKRADEISVELTEKHKAEMLKVIGEKLDQEKYYLEEMVKMRDVIDDLEKMNEDLLSKNKDLDHADDQLPIALAKVKNYETEIEKIQAEKSELQNELDDKMGQIRDLLIFKTNHETLNHDLQEARQKVSEYQYRTIRLEKELKEAVKEREDSELVDQLKLKLEKVLKERELKSDEARSHSNIVQSLRDEVEKLKKDLVATQKEKELIALQHHKILLELQELRKQLLKSKDGSNFKDFVLLKRELKNLKFENEDLKEHILSSGYMSGSLPCIKEERNEKRKSKPNSAASVQPNRQLQSLSYH